MLINFFEKEWDESVRDALPKAICSWNRWADRNLVSGLLSGGDSRRRMLRVNELAQICHAWNSGPNGSRHFLSETHPFWHTERGKITSEVGFAYTSNLAALPPSRLDLVGDRS